jgi:NAD(P)-dependent dehydrogenase (short-subunit alcohol dehydrogenase family)
MPVQVELKDPASVAAMVAAVAARWGGVDIVVNSGRHFRYSWSTA